MSSVPIDTLAHIYQHENLSSVLPDKFEADGMIFAIAAAPEIPMPETWMPWLIKSASSGMVDAEVNTLADGLMDGLRAHLQAMQGQTISLPPRCRATKDGSVQDSPVGAWLTGLLFAHQQLESVWQSAWEKHQQGEVRTDVTDKECAEKRLSRCLKLFSTLANVELAIKQRSPQQAQALKENLNLLWKQLPSVLRDYEHLAGELAAALPNQFEMYTKAP